MQICIMTFQFKPSVVLCAFSVVLCAIPGTYTEYSRSFKRQRFGNIRWNGWKKL
jgi:hypothetical protein